MTPETKVDSIEVTGLPVEVQSASQISTLSTLRPEASQQIADQFVAFLRGSLAQLIELWEKGVSEEQANTLKLIGVILFAIPTLTIVIGIVNIINSIPLFSSLLELVGLVYTVWFTYRYLLFADTRRELSLKTDNLKQRVIGK
jgi:heme A synthase